MVIFRAFWVNNSTNRAPNVQVIVGVGAFSKENKPKRQGSFLLGPILRKSNLMQMCGHFEGFPLNGGEKNDSETVVIVQYWIYWGYPLFLSR